MGTMRIRSVNTMVDGTPGSLDGRSRPDGTGVVRMRWVAGVSLVVLLSAANMGPHTAAQDMTGQTGEFGSEGDWPTAASNRYEGAQWGVRPPEILDDSPLTIAEKATQREPLKLDELLHRARAVPGSMEWKGLESQKSALASAKYEEIAHLSGTPAGPACIPHPNIFIVQDEGPLGFIVGHDPLTGQPIYRPGSGVIAGSGTAQDPYIISGWCIVASGHWLTHTIPGIYLERTNAHVRIEDNLVVSPPEAELSWLGIVTSGASNVTVSSNVVSNHYMGILIDHQSSHITIHSNDLGFNNWGIAVVDSHSVSVESNLVRDGPGVAVHIQTSTDSTIQGNDIIDNEGPGVSVAIQSERISVAGNMIQRSGNLGIGIWDSYHVNIDANVVKESGDDGLQVQRAADSMVALNWISSNRESGLRVSDSPGIELRENSIVDNEGWPYSGLSIARSPEAVAENNIVRGSELALWDSPQGELRRNLVQEGWLGVIRSNQSTIVDNSLDGAMEISGSTGAVVQGNSFSQGGIALLGMDKEEFLHDIDATNTLMGRPIYYIREASGMVVPQDSGQVIIVASDNVTGAGLEIRQATYGALIAYSKDVLVTDSLLEDGYNGVWAHFSHQVTVSHSTMRNHLDPWDPDNPAWAVTIFGGSGNRITKNLLEDSSGAVGLFLSDGNLVDNNTIDANVNGITSVLGGSGDRMRYNNIVQNGLGAGGIDSVALDARYNWWGCPHGPNHADCDSLEGEIVFEPWLTAPNPEAGPNASGEDLS